MASKGAVGAGLNSFLSSFLAVKGQREAQERQRQSLELEKKRIDALLKAEEADKIARADKQDLALKKFLLEQKKFNQQETAQSSLFKMLGIQPVSSAGSLPGQAAVSPSSGMSLSKPTPNFSTQSSSPQVGGGIDLSRLSPQQRAGGLLMAQQSGLGDIGEKLFTVDRRVDLPGSVAENRNALGMGLGKEERVQGLMNTSPTLFDPDTGKNRQFGVVGEKGGGIVDFGEAKRTPLSEGDRKKFFGISRTKAIMDDVLSLHEARPDLFGKEAYVKNNIKLDFEEFVLGFFNGVVHEDPELQEIAKAYADLALNQNAVTLTQSGAQVNAEEMKRLKRQLPMPWDERNRFTGKAQSYMGDLREQDRIIRELAESQQQFLPPVLFKDEEKGTTKRRFKLTPEGLSEVK